ncbi:MAG: transcription termination/antitermination protein NusA [Candidatus Aureabacteria bacterium]|nr:transcription termination/antitermination protein NusA [Candidatus Auribacterota bacterium]
MNEELIAVFDLMERERGIQRDTIIKAIESSLLSASRKSFGTYKNPQISIDPSSGDIKVYAEFVVVADNEKPSQYEVKQSIAKKQHPKQNIKAGDVALIEVTPDNFGRIAAQTAKQVIIQKIREAEKDVIYNGYKDKVGQVVNGIVRRKEKNNVIIELDKAEAVLPKKEQTPNEKYHIGDRLRVLVMSVTRGGTPEVVASRSHPDLVRKLFEIEVPEIYESTVEIKRIARDPGYRTKIAVLSKDEKVDCVGACVGMRGSRVKNIVRELNGEKMDIIPYSDDIVEFARNALNPAKLKAVDVFEEEKRLLVLVDKSQLSLAIGKRGNNARLTSKLLGWKIDIESEEEYTGERRVSSSKRRKREKKREMENGEGSLDIPLDEVEGVNKKVVDYLIANGYDTLKKVASMHVDVLYTIPGVGKSAVEEVKEAIEKKVRELQEE